MPTAALVGGASPTRTGGFTDGYVYSDGTSIPVGRIMANGQGPIIVNLIEYWVSGRSASRTVTAYLGGAATGSFSRASAGAAAATGWLGITAFFANGGSARAQMNFSGQCYFGRHDTIGESYNAGGFLLDGGLAGQFNYVQGPAAPAAPTLTPRAAGEMDITWVAPDNGGTAITGYRVQIATDAAFTSVVQTLNVGAVLTTRATGLTPGTTYYVRVAAKNAVSDTAGTTSVYSASSNAAPLSAGQFWDGATWQYVTSISFWDGVSWKNVTVYGEDGGIWVLPT